MDENTRRSAATTRVMKSISRLLISQRDVLPYRRGDRTAPIVVTLPEDTVGSVSEWVADAGGCANVVLAERDGFYIWSWDGNALASIEAIDVHPDSSMHMLRIYAQRQPESSVSFNVRAAAHAKELAYQF